MKMKRLLVFVSAAALPFATAFAQDADPGGPQGTAWYGYSAPDFAMLDTNRDGVVSADEYAARDLPVERRSPAYGTPSAGATVSPQYDRSQERAMAREERRARYPYSGHSFDTNPPAPAQ
jgi:hypothetical protein